jgi:predicted small lipoprotein YifL
MRRAWPLLALAALAAGGCGQKGPLYLPDKVGKVVTSAPAAPQAQPGPAAATAPVPPPTTPASAPSQDAAPVTTPPATAPTSKPTDKDQEQGSQPPK